MTTVDLSEILHKNIDFLETQPELNYLNWSPQTFVDLSFNCTCRSNGCDGIFFLSKSNLYLILSLSNLYQIRE